MGFFQLPPHSNYTSGGIKTGVAQEYFDLIAKEMKLENINYKELPLPRLISELAEGRIDIGLYLAKNNEREKTFIFSKIPFLEMKPSIALLKNKFQKQELTAEDLKNLTICVWQEGYKSEIIKSDNIKKIKLAGDDITPRCLEMIRLGRADGFYTPDLLSLKYELKKLNIEHLYDIKILHKNEVGLYTVFSKKVDPKIIKHYEDALIKVIRQTPYVNFYLKRLEISN